MKVLETDSASLEGNSEDIFIPMSEVQMETTKGGNDWPGLVPENFEDILAGLADDLVGLVNYFNEVFPAPTMHEGMWLDVQSKLAEDGFVLPDWDLLDPAVAGEGVAW